MSHSDDHNALERKRLELIQHTASTLDAHNTHLAERIVNSFCQLTPPKDPPVLIYLITQPNFGMRGADARKPGDIQLNWRKLFDELAGIAPNTTGPIATPPLVAFAALNLWNNLWSRTNISFSQGHAVALYAMWLGRNANNRIDETVAYGKAASLFQLYQWPPIEARAFTSILRELESLRCIERKDEGLVWLREWVQTPYGG